MGYFYYIPPWGICQEEKLKTAKNFIRSDCQNDPRYLKRRSFLLYSVNYICQSDSLINMIKNLFFKLYHSSSYSSFSLSVGGASYTHIPRLFTCSTFFIASFRLILPVMTLNIAGARASRYSGMSLTII